MSIMSGYPAAPGNKNYSIAEFAGPASYVQVVPAAPVITGGQVIQAAAFGLKYIECVDGPMMSDNGAYIIQAMLNQTAPGKPVTSIRLIWITATSGAEVVAAVDLSGRTVRIGVKGVY